MHHADLAVETTPNHPSNMKGRSLPPQPPPPTPVRPPPLHTRQTRTAGTRTSPVLRRTPRPRPSQSPPHLTLHPWLRVLPRLRRRRLRRRRRRRRPQRFPTSRSLRSTRRRGRSPTSSPSAPSYSAAPQRRRRTASSRRWPSAPMRSPRRSAQKRYTARGRIERGTRKRKNAVSSSHLRGVPSSHPSLPWGVFAESFLFE